MSPPKVFIIILQYNNSQDTIKCLDSVLKIQYPDFEAIIMDNASNPKHLNTIRNYIISQGADQRQIKLIENKENLGYAGGNNVGIKYALDNGADYALILNNDATIEPDALEKLIKVAQSKSKIGILGPAINEGNRIVYGGKIQWLKSELSHLTKIIDCLRFKRSRKMETIYVPGAAMLIKKEVIEKVGLLNEKYFLYFEDADYCLKAYQAGFECKIVPQAMVHHKVSQSTKNLGSPLILRYHFRNSHLFNWVWAPWFYKVLLIFWSGWIILKQLGKIALRKNTEISKSILAGVTDFYFKRWDEIKNKIKIGIECHNLENRRWGIGKHLTKTLEQIAKRPELAKDFEFYLYFKSFIPEDDFLKDSIFKKRMLKIPFIRSSFNIFYHLLLPIACFRDRLNLVFFPGNMLPAFFFGKSLVSLTSDIYYEYKFGSLPLRYKLSYRLFSNWAVKRATKIMAYSNSDKKELMKLWSVKPERIFVNYHGVDPVRSSLAEVLRTRAFGASETSNGVDQNLTRSDLLKLDKTLLFVGQAFERRKVRELILAFSNIVPKFKDLNLIIVGQDKYNPPIINKLKTEINSKLDREAIIHLDYVSDEELLKLYREATLFCYVSSNEAFGLPPLEALAYGTPAIVAKTELTQELFEDNAFFVEKPYDTGKIQEMLLTALNDVSKQKQIIQNKDKVLKKYTWQNHVDNLLNIFKEMV